jgi:hypothetical protein
MVGILGNNNLDIILIPVNHKRLCYDGQTQNMIAVFVVVVCSFQDFSLALGKIQRIFIVHYCVSSNESRGLKILRKYITSASDNGWYLGEQ